MAYQQGLSERGPGNVCGKGVVAFVNYGIVVLQLFLAAFLQVPKYCEYTHLEGQLHGKTTSDQAARRNKTQEFFSPFSFYFFS